MTIWFFMSLFVSVALDSFAAIPVTKKGGPRYVFDVAPEKEEWSTASIGTGSDTIRSAIDMDVAVQELDAGIITNAVLPTMTIPPSQNAFVRWHATDRYLQAKPAGNAYTVLMATLRNDTGQVLPTLSLSYDFGTDFRGVLLAQAEPMPGWRAYFSLTGTAGSWQNIPSFSTASAGSLCAQLPAFSWAPDAVLYVIWVDDNATTETDGGYTLDNFVAVVPRSSGVFSIPSGGVTNGFDAYPEVTNGWSSVPVTGSSSDVITAEDLDAVAHLFAATNINQELWRESTWPPSLDGGNAKASYNYIGQFLQSRPTGSTKANVLLATLQNDTGSNIAALNVSYDYLVLSMNNIETVAGQRVHYSVTGSPGDWQVIPELSGDEAGRHQATLSLGSWPGGSVLYMLWVDDNGPVGTLDIGNGAEGVYGIDNFVVQPTVPAPRLSITRKAPNYLDVAWPYALGNYQLESSADLTNWVPETNPFLSSFSSGFQHHALYSPTNAVYFRLIRP